MLIFFDAGKIYRFSAGSRGSCRRSNNSFSNATLRYHIQAKNAPEKYLFLAFRGPLWDATPVFTTAYARESRPSFSLIAAPLEYNSSRIFSFAKFTFKPYFLAV